MKIRIYIGLILVAGAITTCGESRAGRDVPTVSQTPNYIVNDMCDLLKGHWEATIFKNANEKTKLICNGLPCENGDYDGALKINCSENAYSGIILLAYASSPPPGKRFSSDIDITVNANRVQLAFKDLRQCRMLYDVERSNELLVGHFSQTNCVDKVDYETDDEYKNGIRGAVVLRKIDNLTK